jgi:excisionase family DNA binding protein
MKNRFFKEVVPAIPSDLISVAEAAAISGMTRPTVWRKIRNGELRAWGVRRCYRISLSELLAPVVIRGESRG